MRRWFRVVAVIVLIVALWSSCAKANPVGGDPFFGSYEEGSWYNLAVSYASGVWEYVTVQDSDHPDGERPMLYHFDNVWGGSRGPQHIATEFTLEAWTTETLWWIVDQDISGPVSAGYSHKLQGWNGSAWVDMASLSFNTSGVITSIAQTGGYLTAADFFAEASSCEGLERGGGSLTPYGSFEWADFTNYRIKHQNTIQLDPTTGITWKVATNGLFDDPELTWTPAGAGEQWIYVDPPTYQLKEEHKSTGIQGMIKVSGDDGFRYSTIMVWPFGVRPNFFWNGEAVSFRADEVQYVVEWGDEVAVGDDLYREVTIKKRPGISAFPLMAFYQTNKLVVYGEQPGTGVPQTATIPYYFGIIPETGEQDEDVDYLPPSTTPVPQRSDYPDGFAGTVEYGLDNIAHWLGAPFRMIGDFMSAIAGHLAATWAEISSGVSSFTEVVSGVLGILPEPFGGLLIMAFSLNLFLWILRR